MRWQLLETLNGAWFLPYIVAQVLGGFIGGLVVWLAYLPHWNITEDKGAILGTFATGPAVRNYPANVLTEIIGTFVLVFLAY